MYKRLKYRIIFLSLSIFLIGISLTQPVYANQQSWDAWVAQLRQEAIADGIRPEVFDEAFSTVTEPQQQVLSLDKHQPENRLSYLEYRNTRCDAGRINLGVKSYLSKQVLLENIGAKYGVDACFITAFWGIETSYGHYMGNFPVIQSLATLAYDSRRGDKFRKELLYALQILNGGHIDLQDFKGEWAGASGIPQFLPSSWYRYAVDYDGDGRKDIWKSYGDAFASIANYLVINGWQRGQPWGAEVEVPDNLDSSLIGFNHTKTVAEWQQLGVTAKPGWQLPSANTPAYLIEPDGGPNYLVFNNFRVIMRYNNSIFYAGTVAYLADKICQKARGYDTLQAAYHQTSPQINHQDSELQGSATPAVNESSDPDSE